MKKKKRTFSLKMETVDLLSKLSNKEHRTLSKIVELAVTDYYSTRYNN